MKDRLIDIIIPVYNGQSTIRDCLLSVLKQTHQCFKVYVINDGSTDDTSLVLEQFSKDERIEIIHQKNSGVSVARNKGLALSKGEFVAFIDADDTVSPNYLESLLEVFSDNTVDLSVCSYKVIDKILNQERICSFHQELLTRDYAIEYLMSEKGPQGYLWNKLFRTSIIKSNNLAFDSQIFMAEDLLFVIQYIIKADGKIRISDKVLYNYLVYSESSNKTRLSTLDTNYRRYFENFLLCVDKIDACVPKDFTFSKKAIIGRRGRIAIQFIRANYLRANVDKELNKKLSKIAKEGKRSYFAGLDASRSSKVIYNLVLYFPYLAYLRDRIHFK